MEVYDVRILFAKLSPNAKIPTKIEEDAGFDLYACIDDRNPYGWQIDPHTTMMIPTGLIYACPKEWAIILKERGSTGIISMKIGAGVCDSGFRNEVVVQLYNGLNKSMVISPTEEKVRETEKVVFYPVAKAIAQFLVLPVPRTLITETTVDEILAISSERKQGMLGSSGK